jgi:hypothetical protein
MLWQLKRLCKQVEVLATVSMLVGLVLLVIAGQSIPGTVLVSGGAYALVLPQFIEPHNPIA